MDMETGEFNIFSQQAGDLGEPVVLFYLTCKTEERRLSASLKTDSLRQRTNCCSVFFLYPGFWDFEWSPAKPPEVPSRYNQVMFNQVSVTMQPVQVDTWD